MKIDMHLHSNYSRILWKFWTIDALNTPIELLKTAKKLGLDGIALTDHNTIRGCDSGKKFAKKNNMLLVPGCELSTKEGHLLAYFLQKEIKPFLPVEEAIDEIKKQGALVAAPHPYHPDLVESLMWRIDRIKVDAIEVFNARSFHVFDIINYNLAKKRKMPMIAGSDAHAAYEMGGVYTEYDVSSEEELRKKFKKGVPVYKYSTPKHLVLNTYFNKLKMKLKK